MKVVVDVNIIISAMIRDSTTRKILLNSRFDFFFPEKSLDKIRKYQEYVLKKSGLTEEEYNTILRILFKYIRIVSLEDIEKNWSKAKKVMGAFDVEDIVFISSAMNLPGSVIWSDDKDFDKQDAVKVLKTKDIVEL